MSDGQKEGRSDAKVLVIDDEPQTLDFCREALLPMVAEVETAQNGSEGFEHLARKNFDVVVTDLQMPGIDGFALIEGIKSRWMDVEIVAITGYPDEKVVERLLSLGVTSLLVKPFTIAQLCYTVMAASKTAELRRENESLRLAVEKEPFGIVGRSAEIRTVISQIRQVGPLDVPVLIEGESGTGKELVARAIHACSRRSKGAFVAVSCAAVSPQLIESELFGHVKGAFTGAISDKMGLIEAADKGTLFLDEIGEMPLDMQPKLLRVLDRGEILRVGDTKPRYADIRVIAATNRNLMELTASGKFREDLLFRIRGFTIKLPPLRERGADVILLAEHFLREFCPPGRKPLRLTPEARQALLSHSWPGNVRELQNLAAALYASESSSIVTAISIARLLGMEQEKGTKVAGMTYKDFKRSELARLEIEYFTQLLTAFEGNVSRAAEAAGMYRANLREKLRRYGIDPSDFKSGRKQRV